MSPGGVQIPGAGVDSGQGDASTGPNSDKEKGKAVPHVVLTNTEVLSEEDDAPPVEEDEAVPWWWVHCQWTLTVGATGSWGCYRAATRPDGGVDGARRVWL
jgi:hypothetical protein